MKKVSMKKNWDNPRENSMPLMARVPASIEIGGVLVAEAEVMCKLEDKAEIPVAEAAP